MNDTTYIETTDPKARQRDGGRDVPGWGADLDAAQRPAVPMERTPPRLDHVPGPLAVQPNRHGIRVFHSTERPGLSPVWGTSAPPAGLSGAMRALGYRFSENDLRRWLVLLMADRVNVAEGIVQDLARGHVPNIFKEMGGPAEWRYNRAGFVKKALIASAALALAVWLLRRERD